MKGYIFVHFVVVVVGVGVVGGVDFLQSFFINHKTFRPVLDEK